MAGAALAGQAIRSSGARTRGARGGGGPGEHSRPALLALRSGDLAAYHGVEHKAIAAYEQDGDAADADKEHDRCGSNLVAPMLGAAAVGNVAARRAGTARARWPRPAWRWAARPWRWRSSPGPSATRAPRCRELLRRPGFEIQRVMGTREPTRRAARGGPGRAGGDPPGRGAIGA